MYEIDFMLNGEINSVSFKSVQRVECGLSDDAILALMKKKPSGALLTKYYIAAASMVLANHPEATDFVITYEEDQQSSSNENKGNGAGAILLILAIVLAVLIAPLFVTLGMYGKFLLKGIYKDALELEAYKRFRKPYLIGCYAVFGVFLVLFIVGIATAIPVLLYIGLYGLFLGNLGYFIFGWIMVNKMKKANAQ